MDKEKIQQLAEDAIGENQSLFLVGFSLSPDNKIEVLVDGDDGISIDEIIRISRFIEHNLDRDSEDFSLNVSSPGVGKPLLLPRQYKKNVGRTLKVNRKTAPEIEGELVAADDESIILKWKSREPKPVGKGKQTVEKEEKINYKEINKATITIIF